MSRVSWSHNYGSVFRNSLISPAVYLRPPPPPPARPPPPERAAPARAAPPDRLAASERTLDLAADRL